MDEKNNCSTCGLYVSSLDDYCSGCNMRTKYYGTKRQELSSILTTGGFALLLLITGLVRNSLG